MTGNVDLALVDVQRSPKFGHLKDKSIPAELTKKSQPAVDISSTTAAQKTTKQKPII